MEKWKIWEKAPHPEKLKSNFDQVWSNLDRFDQIWSKTNYHFYYQGQVDWLKRLKICEIWKIGKFLETGPFPDYHF